jgi:CheY-like chemotaxis protein
LLAHYSAACGVNLIALLPLVYNFVYYVLCTFLLWSVLWDPEGIPVADVHDLPLDMAYLLDDPRAGSVTLSVKDSGAGLSPDQLANICSEGVQFNANKLQAGGGSGLGLFISKGLVEQHGGSMTVLSEGLEKGSTFLMELPLYQIPPAPVEIVRQKPTPNASRRNSLTDSSGRGTGTSKVVPCTGTPLLDGLGSSSGPVGSGAVTGMGTGAGTGTGTGTGGGIGVLYEEEDDSEGFRGDSGKSVQPGAPSPSFVPMAHARQKRVLVVDDAPSNRKLLMRILQAKGYLVDGAEDGQQAVDLYDSLVSQEETVDAIIMDYEMPVMDGPAATKVIRSRGCQCFIAGVTGNISPDDVAYFKKHGANTVLPKPLTIETFESLFKSYRPHHQHSSRRGHNHHAHGHGHGHGHHGGHGQQNTSTSSMLINSLIGRTSSTNSPQFVGSGSLRNSLSEDADQRFPFIEPPPIDSSGVSTPSITFTPAQSRYAPTAASTVSSPPTTGNTNDPWTTSAAAGAGAGSGAATRKAYTSSEDNNKSLFSGSSPAGSAYQMASSTVATARTAATAATSSSGSGSRSGSGSGSGSGPGVSEAATATDDPPTAHVRYDGAAGGRDNSLELHDVV